MRIRPGIILVLATVLAVLFGGRYLGWYGPKKSDPITDANSGAPPEADPTVVVTSPAPPPTPTPAPVPRPIKPVRPANPANTAGTTVPKPAADAGTEMIANWEERIDALLTTEGDESDKAKQLLQMIPRLPEEGQVEATQHLSNLLADEDFAALMPMLTNLALSEEVLDVLLTDVLNRPNGLKLPALLEMARTPNHPKAEEARDILEIYVDEDYGEDWVAWDAQVRRWLQENPD